MALRALDSNCITAAHAQHALQINNLFAQNDDESTTNRTLWRSFPLGSVSGLRKNKGCEMR